MIQFLFFLVSESHSRDFVLLVGSLRFDACTVVRILKKQVAPMVAGLIFLFLPSSASFLPFLPVFFSCFALYTQPLRLGRTSVARDCLSDSSVLGWGVGGGGQQKRRLAAILLSLCSDDIQEASGNVDVV